MYAICSPRMGELENLPLATHANCPRYKLKYSEAQVFGTSFGNARARVRSRPIIAQLAPLEPAGDSLPNLFGNRAARASDNETQLQSP